MPNDVITLNSLVYELNSTLKNGRIDKIFQPEKDELLLSIRIAQQSYLLCIAVNPNNPRVHLTSQKKDNPYTAYSFLMHLRRHIQGAIIQNISLPQKDRVICFELHSKTELKDSVKYELYTELMGRYSNLILVSDNVITDALRHFPPSEKDRCILPRAKYESPSNAKISPFDYESIFAKLSQMSGVPLFDYATKHIGGFASTTLLEIIYRSNLSPYVTTLFDHEIESFLSVLGGFLDIAANPKQYLPCLQKGANGYVDYCICPYTHTGKSYKECDTLNKAIEIYSSQKDKNESLVRASKGIYTPLNRAIKKINRIINYAIMKIEESKNADKYRIYGELITCNLHNLTKGQKSAVLYDFYQNKEVEITLDAQKSPQANAQSYYKKYGKLKRTFDIVTEQIKANKEELEYLLSIKQNLLMAEETADLEDISTELEKHGIYKQNSKKKKVIKVTAKSTPASYDINGYIVLRGKNNIQNSWLTFKRAKDTDVWLHAKNGHGAHVIIKSDGQSVPEDVLLKAGEIATYFSSYRENDKAVVDYTQKRYVKRHPSNKIGMVVYTNQKSLIVKPTSHEQLLETNSKPF